MAALARGSVSLRIYPHNDLAAPAVVDELLAQAALAAAHGFDGVMTSEHHGGFAGYLPNPVQAAGWMLDAMATGWAAPCPVLITLRPPALVVEEIAWLAARFPARVGVGVAAGALEDDFAIMGTTLDGLAARFTSALETIAGMFGGTAPGRLAGDKAIAHCVDHPVPVVSAAMGFTACRRAARVGVGLLFDSLLAPDRCRELIDAYHDAGGQQPCILIRRAWLGEAPRQEFDRQVDVYRGYASQGAQTHWRDDELVAGDDPVVVAGGLNRALRRAGADALNLRVHAPGMAPAAVREQIAAIGDEVLPMLTTAWDESSRPG